MSDNKNILKVELTGENQKIFFHNGNYIEVPKVVNGQALPLVDPYDKATGNGYMVQNAIIDSKLSSNAKIVYCALRRHICYNTGFTFVDLYKPKEKKTETDALTLEDTTSLTRNPIKAALEELEHFKIISIGKYLFRGARKNIYVFKPIEHWKLPTKESAEQYHSELTAKRKAKDKERQERKKKTLVMPFVINAPGEATIAEPDDIYLEDEFEDDIGIILQTVTDEIFRFTEGEYIGKTMQEVYNEDFEYVWELSEGSTDPIILAEAQRIIDIEMPI